MNDLWRLLRLFKPYLGWMLLGALLSLITLLANVALLTLSGWFISAMALAGVAGVGMNYFTPAALIRGAAITRTAGRYAERLVTHEATFRLLAQLRVWFYERIEPLAPAVLAQYRSGDVLSRIRADIDTLNQVYLRLLVPIIVAVLSSLMFVIVLAYYHPIFALIELSLLSLAGLFIPWLMNRLGNAMSRASVASAAHLRSALVNDLQGMGELLVYGAAPQQAAELEQYSQQWAMQQRYLSRLNGMAQGALGLCANLAVWLMLIVAIPLVTQGTLAPPHLAMLALFTLASFEAVAPLPLALQSLGEMLAAARRIFSLADQPPAITEPAQSLPLHSPLHINFQQVDFRYSPNSPLILQRFDLMLTAGQKMALVGSTGIGKSTVAHLLLRFYEPSSGHININGQPIQAYHSETLRQHIAALVQHTHLFNTTIRANLLLAKSDASDAEVEAVCRLVLMHDFICSQPAGYDTWVGETGVRLSGGQARRLALARTLLKPASVLILDEPLEGLDPDTAQQVMQNLLQHAEQQSQSLLLITHQAYGLQAMDHIIQLSAPA